MILSTPQYKRVRKKLREACGVELGPERVSMVSSRLGRRVTALSMDNIDAYVDYVLSIDDKNPEWQNFIDLLTTHETYFYREATHFDFLKQIVFPKYRQNELQVFSAACSSGEEVYTLAFEMAEFLGLAGRWSVEGADIAENVLRTAQRGIYEEVRARLVPEKIQKRYMLQGTGDKAGYCMVKREIRDKVAFRQENILDGRRPADRYDVIFCRNVLIYFDDETKQTVINNLYRQLKPGGYLVVSRTEQLRRFLNDSVMISTSIARKPEE